MHQISISPLTPQEYPCLEHLLYLALFQLPDAPPLPKNVIFQPQLYAYIEQFGREHDLALAARANNQVIGAVWTRLLHSPVQGYGNIDPFTPELAIALLPEYRGQGIGTQLLLRMFDLLRQNTYTCVSLSVDHSNPCARLYQKLGFMIVEKRSDDFLMCKQLS